MTDINPQNFEHGVLEADIERLSREVKEIKKTPEHRELTERELVKTAVRPFIARQAARQTADDSQIQSRVLPDYFKNLPSETKLAVEELVDSIFHKGIENAVKRARRMSPFILDAFHDALIDKLHGELKKRKMI